ncbi:MAG: hypothetical protein PF693_12770 [Spirochaetia bacterium]|jgi:hypothetical protein|nr:hypothetical protein [Spirochaetia bacterium]
MKKMSRSFKRHIKNSKNRKNKMEKFSSHYGDNVEKFTQCYEGLTFDVEIKKIKSGSDSVCNEEDFFFN